MEQVLEFERFDDANEAHSALAKSEGIARISFSHGAWEIGYTSGLTVKFRVKAKTTRAHLARLGTCSCHAAAT